MCVCLSVCLCVEILPFFYTQNKIPHVTHYNDQYVVYK